MTMETRSTKTPHQVQAQQQKVAVQNMLKHEYKPAQPPAEKKK